MEPWGRGLQFGHHVGVEQEGHGLQLDVRPAISSPSWGAIESVRDSEVSKSCLRLGMAAACRRCH